MTDNWIDTPPDASEYLLANVRIPPALCRLKPEANGWCQADIQVRDGCISAVEQCAQITANAMPRIDADHSILLSGLVDCHTHLDKTHVAAFADFPACDLPSAIEAMAENKNTWTADNMARRVDFSLRTAYANGVRAMRSHVDFTLDGPEFIWPVMSEAVEQWCGKVDLQLSPLANVTMLENPEFRRGFYGSGATQGRIGLFLYDQSDLAARLTPIFEHAKAQGWDIDLHVDEGLNPELDGLNAVAQVTLATGFRGTVLCGHSVALGVYDPARRAAAIALCAKAGLHFVALPTTNLYLQARGQADAPQLRGMAPVAQLAQAGAVVSMGADNVGDGFCAFGDFDPMAVLNLGSLVGHLHEPARDWAALVTSNPARTMGLDWDGCIQPGAPADLVLFSGRNSRELGMRSAPERIVIRNGSWLDNPVPGFRELTEGM